MDYECRCGSPWTDIGYCDMCLQENAIMSLKKTLSNDFLSTMVLFAKTAGWWNGDYVEVENFIMHFHEVAGVDCPDLTPIF